MDDHVSIIVFELFIIDMYIVNVRGSDVRYLGGEGGFEPNLMTSHQGGEGVENSSKMSHLINKRPLTFRLLFMM